MRLLVINENALYRIGDAYYSVYSWVRFPQHLSEHCEGVTLWSPVAVEEAGSEPPEGSWHVELGNLRMEERDYYDSFVQYYRLWLRKARAWRRQAGRLVRDHDAVILRTPSAINPIVLSAARRHKKPLVVMMAGNMETQSDRIIASRGLKKLFYTGVSKFFARQEARCAEYASLAYTYSKELAESRLSGESPAKLIRTPHLSLKDHVEREDSCQSDVIRLLRVSWLIPSKGLEHLLEAMAMLLNDGCRVKLDIVGKERQDGYQARLEDLSRRLGVSEAVNFRGWVPFDQIEDLYIRSDVQVISSLTEGTPRCIVEGAARGLPLVSTSAGGCADALIHNENALVVAPGDPKALAAGIRQVISDGELRRRLIAGGYEMAREFAFENIGMRFLDEVREVVTAAQRPA